MKFAFIIDPIVKIDPTHDSTIAMMEAAQKLGHDVYITSIEQLTVIKGKAYAHLQQLAVRLK